MSNIKKNFVYNLVYQILNLLLPFITVPIISRALGAESSGIYSYTYSIVNYFMIFGMLGISNYGNRKIAKSRDNKESLSKNFLSIYSLQLCFNLISIIIYLIYTLLFSQYKLITTVEILFLLSNLLDISWFYFGLEKFKITVTRNIFVKIISLLLIICLVKNPEDLLIYTIIMAASTIISQAILWWGIKQHITLKNLHLVKRDFTKHIKGIFILFIPVISYSIYRIMDKIMLGIQSSMAEVGYYEYAEKIIGIPLGFIAALGAVMLPQISNLVANKNIGKTMAYLEKSLKFLMLTTIPCAFGLIAISHDFSILFLGSDYARTGQILNFLSITLFFTAWANVIRTQWLIPQEKDSIYVSTTILGAIVNFVINLCLIPSLGGIGAAIGTIAAEFIIMFSQSFFIRKEIPLKRLAMPTVKFFIAGLIMFLACLLLNALLINQPPVVNIIVDVLTGALIYLLLNVRSIKDTCNTQNI